MNKDKFTISEIRKFLSSQDSFGDVMHNLSAENIIKANTEDPIVIYKNWLADTFQSITEDTHNGETIEDISIDDDGDDITILFTVDGNRAGKHDDNRIIINKKIGYSEVKVRLCELLEGGGIEEELETKIKENITQLLNLKLDE
jgi:hypothetical protein